jgi:hypothetical protein
MKVRMPVEVNGAGWALYRAESGEGTGEEAAIPTQHEWKQAFAHCVLDN